MVLPVGWFKSLGDIIPYLTEKQKIESFNRATVSYAIAVGIVAFIIFF